MPTGLPATSLGTSDDFPCGGPGRKCPKECLWSAIGHLPRSARKCSNECFSDVLGTSDCFQVSWGSRCHEKHPSEHFSNTLSQKHSSRHFPKWLTGSYLWTQAYELVCLLHLVPLFKVLGVWTAPMVEDRPQLGITILPHAQIRLRL